MSVRRKLFVAMAAFIVGMGLVFAFVTQVVVQDTLDVMVEAARKDEVEALSGAFGEFYEANGGSWEGVEQLAVEELSGAIAEFYEENSGLREDAEQVAVGAGERSMQGNGDASFLLMARDQQVLYAFGDAGYQKVTRFGIQKSVRVDDTTVAFLYYYDQDVDYMSKLRNGILVSTKVLLFAGTILFVVVSLLVAFWLSKRLTAPLRSLIPAIDRLGRGEFGVQVPVVSRDEYGKVAAAFNGMSEQLGRGEEVRRNLVADVAHELRTPLTIVQGKLDLLQQQGEPVAPESLLPLQDELIRLTRLVGDLHQLSLAEAKKLPLDRKSTDVAGLLRRIVERVRYDAESKGIEVRFDCLAERTTAEVDAHRITQVFLNLVVNAVRYTPEGGSVRVTVDGGARRDARTDGRVGTRNDGRVDVREDGQMDSRSGNLRVVIADTGIGIDSEHLPYLFNRFYRTDDARDRNSGGMGLGLAIAKQFVLAHDGQIEVESEVGRGTRFIVTLPSSVPDQK